MDRPYRFLIYTRGPIGPRDLLETIPRAISDRMVPVPSDFVNKIFFLYGNERKKIQNRSAILNLCSREPPSELSYWGGCEDTSIHVGVSKTVILSTFGPWDLLESIPRAISDRMVRVPSDFVSSRAILGQDKVPRAFSTSGVLSNVQNGRGCGK